MFYSFDYKGAYVGLWLNYDEWMFGIGFRFIPTQVLSIGLGPVTFQVGLTYEGCNCDKE